MGGAELKNAAATLENYNTQSSPIFNIATDVNGFTPSGSGAIDNLGI